jgi:uncharacterized membrane protein YiaA
MNTRKTLSWLLLFWGEAIIITAFILFRGNTPDDILTLNIVVSSLIYGLFFLNYRIPWIDVKDESQKQVGTLGINWSITWFYAILAIATMVCGNLAYNFAFTTQLIIHCTLLFFLFLSMFGARRAADKIQDIYEVETKNRSGIDEMKAAMQQLKDKIYNVDGLPQYFTQSIDTIDENLRFLSPVNNQERYGLERTFIETINEIKFAISGYSMNEEQIKSNLKKLEHMYHTMKNIYSK